MSNKQRKVVVINLDNIFITIMLFLAAIAVESFTGLELGTVFYVLMGFGLGVLIPPIRSYTYEVKEDDKIDKDI